MKNEGAKHDAWLMGEYEYTPEELEEMKEPKLGPNAKIFERVLMDGLQSANIDPFVFMPFIGQNTENGKTGFAICQLRVPKGKSNTNAEDKALDTMVCCYEDGLEWNMYDSCHRLPITKDQPAYMLGVLILVSIMKKNPIYPAPCSHCNKKK